MSVITLKIAILFLLAWHSRFVMDEFVQLGWAKYLGNGLFDTVWNPKAVGYAVFYKLPHLIGWDATSILLIGRIQTTLLACGTIAIIYACARALGESRLRALTIILVMLSFSNVMERIFRTIAEPLALFFAAAALLAVLRGQADRARTVVVAGILSGLSFLATQKAVYFNLSLGLALVVDAALAGRFIDGVKRGAWLVLGWLVPVIAYCIIFGGTDPVPIAKFLIFGPVEIATTGQNAYPGGLRTFVWKTLIQNAVLYMFCFIGMALALGRITSLGERARIALVFTTVITALVFMHNQPWPYVFIMALPFVALWSLRPIDRIPAATVFRPFAWAVLGIAVVASSIKNVMYMQLDNKNQLELVARAESLVGPNERYFDGIGMLPNRSEPSTLWLDRIYVRRTLLEGESSEAYRIFANRPPKIILWSYRTEAIESIIAPLVVHSYAQVAANIRMAGQRLRHGVPTVFIVPIAGNYRLYDDSGTPVPGRVVVDGKAFDTHFRLSRGKTIVTLQNGPASALLLIEGSYAGKLTTASDNRQLFDGVYN